MKQPNKFKWPIFLLILSFFYDWPLSRLIPEPPTGRPIAGGICFVLLILLITLVVLYTKEEIRIRKLYWATIPEGKYKNNYTRRAFLVFLLPMIPVFGIHIIIPKSASEFAPQFIFFIFLLTSLWAAMIMAHIILYGREEKLMSAAAFIKFAKELGADDIALEEVKRNPLLWNREWAGTWAQTKINYMGQDFIFIGRDRGFKGGQRGPGQLPCIVVGTEIGRTHAHVQSIIKNMDENTKMIFEGIRSKLKWSEFYKQDGKLWYSVPLIIKYNFNNEINTEVLKEMMDVLYSAGKTQVV